MDTIERIRAAVDKLCLATQDMLPSIEQRAKVQAYKAVLAEIDRIQKVTFKVGDRVEVQCGKPYHFTHPSGRLFGTIVVIDCFLESHARAYPYQVRMDPGTLYHGHSGQIPDNLNLEGWLFRASELDAA